MALDCLRRWHHFVLHDPAQHEAGEFDTVESRLNLLEFDVAPFAYEFATCNEGLTEPRAGAHTVVTPSAGDCVPQM